MKVISVALLALLASGTMAMADGIPKFGKTCIGSVGKSTKVCLTSNGKTVSSTYMFLGKFSTQGQHTSCTVKAKTITCKSGNYRTSQESGKMSGVVITMRGNAPAAMAWR